MDLSSFYKFARCGGENPGPFGYVHLFFTHFTTKLEWLLRKFDARTLGIATFSIMTLDKTTFSITALSITAFSIKTHNIKGLFEILSICDVQHNYTQHKSTRY
jgi:hypothetical protein